MAYESGGNSAREGEPWSINIGSFGGAAAGGVRAGVGGGSGVIFFCFGNGLKNRSKLEMIKNLIIVGTSVTSWNELIKIFTIRLAVQTSTAKSKGIQGLKAR